MALQLFKIASTTVESPVSSITFSSIPSGYVDLKLVVSARGVSSTGLARALQMKINSDTTYSNYTMVAVITNDTGSVTTTKFTSATNLPFYLYGIPSANATANSFGTAEIYLHNYTGSTNKSFSAESLAESNDSSLLNGTSYNGITGGLWSQTSAITTISLNPDTGDFASNTTATLYGIM